MEIKKELLDELLKDYQTPEDVIGENGLLKQLTKALLERAMSAELTNHLGYEKNDPAGYHSGNSRNGATPKTLKGDFGEMVIETPRDRNGSFEPHIIKKHQTRFDGFDDKILSMYARGMSTREIQGHLQEMYGVEVSPTLISEVTDGVMEEVKAWQNRPLEPVYGVVYLDALYVKMRHEGRVENRAVYVAIGIGLDGQKDVLGLWTSNNEGAKFWLGVYREAHVLLEELAEAVAEGTRKQYMDMLATVPLLIMDDFGMRKLPLTAAEDLLEIVMRRYERASTLLTSNRPVDDWGKLLGDTASVGSMLDRLLHHGHVLKCGPRSWRTKTAGGGDQA